ncbi:hypothetical protein ATY41_08175 [Leifsonia xyli subsp. xyli]|uniref:Uncharacterized protein n=1 Tax=Leifsonia xyli subsp. xyli TaxID=59736 RepID=A0A1E2SMC6_LEIXY|nr:hypothetical protein ATY41_08175 [Leifsonia xyli subsp. xyli]
MDVCAAVPSAPDDSEAFGGIASQPFASTYRVERDTLFFSIAEGEAVTDTTAAQELSKRDRPPA